MTKIEPIENFDNSANIFQNDVTRYFDKPVVDESTITNVETVNTDIPDSKNFPVDYKLYKNWTNSYIFTNNLNSDYSLAQNDDIANTNKEKATNSWIYNFKSKAIDVMAKTLAFMVETSTKASNKIKTMWDDFAYDYGHNKEQEAQLQIYQAQSVTNFLVESIVNIGENSAEQWLHNEQVSYNQSLNKLQLAEEAPELVVEASVASLGAITELFEDFCNSMILFVPIFNSSTHLDEINSGNDILFEQYQDQKLSFANFASEPKLIFIKSKIQELAESLGIDTNSMEYQFLFTSAYYAIGLLTTQVTGSHLLSLSPAVSHAVFFAMTSPGNYFTEISDEITDSKLVDEALSLWKTVVLPEEYYKIYRDMMSEENMTNEQINETIRDSFVKYYVSQKASDVQTFENISDADAVYGYAYARTFVDILACLVSEKAIPDAPKSKYIKSDFIRNFFAKSGTQNFLPNIVVALKPFINEYFSTICDNEYDLEISTKQAIASFLVATTVTLIKLEAEELEKAFITLESDPNKSGPPQNVVKNEIGVEKISDSNIPYSVFDADSSVLIQYIVENEKFKESFKEFLHDGDAEKFNEIFQEIIEEAINASK